MVKASKHSEVLGTAELSDDSKDLDVSEYFGDKKVRWFQIASHNMCVAWIKEGVKRILIKLPTGSGKTITAVWMLNSPQLRDALKIKGERPLRVLFIAHKHRLLTQAERTFGDEANVDVIYQSAFSAIPDEVIAQGWDIVVIDEAHHEAMMTIQRQLTIIGDYVIIGLTATDERADGCVIKFQKIAEPISRQQAVEEGYLAPTRLHSIFDPTSGDKSLIILDVLQNFHIEMGQTMIFVKTLKEAGIINDFLTNELKQRSVLISKQSETVVDRILDDFSAGEHQFIVNCNKINEGVDVKGCTDILAGRQYGSYAQLNQVIGRASRPDSDCNVWELINPLNGKNKDTTVIVGEPEMHRLLFKRAGKWLEREFDYTATSLTSALYGESFAEATGGGLISMWS